MSTYFKNITTCLSQILNTIIGGNPDMTLSSRAYVSARKGNKYGIFFEKVINYTFFWQNEHCFFSWMQDVRYANYVYNTERFLMKNRYAN